MAVQPNEQMAYDRGATIFSPDGRLYQVEYAREAVKRGSISVGVTTSDSVILAAEKQVDSELLVEESIEKIYTVDDHIALAASGHVADARQLVEHARVQAQRNYYLYEEPLGVQMLAKYIGDHIQQHTQFGGTRPFGCALLIGGVDERGPKLIESEPSGAIIGYKATGIGEGREDAEETLEKEWEENMTTEDGIELALGAILEKDTSIEDVECVLIKEDKVERLSPEELEKHSS